MAKLLENTYRLVNISMINELALLCGKMRIDIWEVIEAAKTKPYGFSPFYPTSKIGGHCIPLDPFYLSFKAREYNFWPRFIELAGEINEQMPHFTVVKVNYLLNKNKKSINGSKILVWGVAYKKDVNDARESGAYDVISELIKKGAEVNYFDPYVKELKIKDSIFAKGLAGNKKELKSIEYNPEILKNYDLVLILTDHSGFNYDEIARNSNLVVDTRNAIKSREHKNVIW
jgi:UDP-N-acetyl-D-glucosamine dehydrogenase